MLGNLSIRTAVSPERRWMEQMKADCISRIKRVPSESLANELVCIKQDLIDVKRQLCESLTEMRARLEAEIGKLLYKNRSLEIDSPDAQRNERWKHTQTEFDLYAADCRNQKRKFSDVTTEIARWL
jgi:hypothetical protein